MFTYGIIASSGLRGRSTYTGGRPLKLIVTDIWSPHLDPPSEGLPADPGHFSVLVQVAVGEDAASGEVFQFTVASPGAEASPDVPALRLDRFEWEAIESWDQRQLDQASVTARTWEEVIAALAPVMAWTDRTSAASAPPMTERDRSRLVAAWIEHWTRFLRELPRFQAMQAAGRELMLKGALQSLLMPWKAHDLAESLGRQLRDELGSLSSSETQWASQEVSEVIGRGDDDGWALLMALVRAVPEELLVHVGAGPAEVFFDDETAARFRTEIRQALATEPRFRAVLEVAWNLPDEIQDLLATPAPEPPP
jgi:hypothetical protein